MKSKILDHKKSIPTQLEKRLCKAIINKQLLAEQAKNKKLVEALEEILKVFSEKHSVNGYEHTTLTIVRNALNEVNK